MGAPVNPQQARLDELARKQGFGSYAEYKLFYENRMNMQGTNTPAIRGATPPPPPRPAAPPLTWFQKLTAALTGNLPPQ